jgi:hypothetical protein
MHVVVNVSGGQGFLPDEVRDNAILQQAFAQDIVDRYCGAEYFDPDVIEYYQIPSLWYQLKLWLKACPIPIKVKHNRKPGGYKP